jgi:hypothetical protein
VHFLIFVKEQLAFDLVLDFVVQGREVLSRSKDLGDRRLILILDGGNQGVARLFRRREGLLPRRLSETGARVDHYRQGEYGQRNRCEVPSTETSLEPAVHTAHVFVAPIGCSPCRHEFHYR